MYWYVSIFSEKYFWPQYMYLTLSPNNGFRWCPLVKLSHLGLEQLLCGCYNPPLHKVSPWQIYLILGKLVPLLWSRQFFYLYPSTSSVYLPVVFISLFPITMWGQIDMISLPPPGIFHALLPWITIISTSPPILLYPLQWNQIIQRKNWCHCCQSGSGRWHQRGQLPW